LKQLVDAGKVKGYLLYDDINEVLPEEVGNGEALDDILAGLDVAGIEILDEEPRLAYERKPEEPEEAGELEGAGELEDEWNAGSGAY
jgi:hypothetical protein